MGPAKTANVQYSCEWPESRHSAGNVGGAGRREVVNTIGVVHTETIEGTRPCLLVATHSAVLGDGCADSASDEVGEVCRLGMPGARVA
jgi:hypothetical protein